MDNKELLWKKFLSLIKKKVSSLGYDTWFKDTELVDLNEEAIVLVPSVTHKKHLEQSYKDMMEEVLASIAGTNFNMVFVLSDEIKDLDTKKEEKIEKSPEEDNSYKNRKITNLNPTYTFNSFMVGGSNEFARTAALAVAENPGKIYNPFFIYGNSGLGKTHLMHAIGNYIVDNSNLRVLYVTSETFINDFLGISRKNIDGNNFDYIEAFKDKYRNIDVLLIDDIQFLGTAPKSQAEFFHTFNTLFDEKKQIIISSDNSPDDLRNLEDRLKTRFNWGLKVNIYPPDNELKKKILKNKLTNMTYAKDMDEEVIDFITNVSESDVRSLEGMLTRVCAYAEMFNADKITEELAIEALQGTFNGNVATKNNIQKIQKIVADYYGITIEDLKGKKRVAKVSLPRHIAIYLCRTMTDESFPRIGMEFGGRDHSTVMNSCDKISSDIKTNERLKEVIEELKKKIKK
jgi:chromosomal replication initiator protein